MPMLLILSIVIAVVVWFIVQEVIFSYRQHKAVLDEVCREEEGLAYLSEEFTRAFVESSFPHYDNSLDVFHLRDRLVRLAQLVEAINGTHAALLHTAKTLEQARRNESDFDPNVLEQAMDQSVDAIFATMEAARGITGFFRNDFKTLIPERGRLTFKRLLKQLRLLALQEENRRMALEQEQTRAKQAQAQAQTMTAQAEKARADADRAALDKIAANAAAIPLRSYLDFLRAKFDAVTREELVGDNHARLFELYGALKEAFQRHHLLPPEQLEPIATDVKRLDQIETLIDLYSEKIRRVQQDDTLDPEEQQLKINYWIRIRDRDIAELEK